MRRAAFAVAAIALLAPGAAQAKGTNVRISSAPNGADAGDRWTPLITVSMPGRGRVDGLQPRVVIRRGDVRRTFAARPTGRVGVYRAAVVFPARGRWEWGVDDGLDPIEPGAGRVYGFPAVTIGPDQPPLAGAPRPVSGEIDPVAVLDGPMGQLPPRRRSLAQPGDDDGGRSFPLVALAIVPATGAAALAFRRRRRAGRSSPSARE